MKGRVVGTIGFMLLIFFASAFFLPSAKVSARTIEGNGTEGISIEIDGYPYNTLNYSNIAYTELGCTWFVSSRLTDLTKTVHTIYGGSNWYNSKYANYGYSRGTTLSKTKRAIACWSNHVCLIEKVNGNVITITEGGYSLGNNSTGYTRIANVSSSYFASDQYRGTFLGYVYTNISLIAVQSGPIGEMTTPTITTNASWYSVGSTMTVTWLATSKDTDFYQYWVVVKNMTTGEVYYGGATGGAGDPSKNSLSIKCPKAGMYKIDVYSVPYNEKDARSKVSSKTIPIGSGGEMTTPIITTNAPWYSVGSTMKVTWPATSKDTDFYQYWVVIKNILTGTKYYGGATTAAAGDPSKNSVSIKCSDAGMYKIDVYSVPYSDKNARSKVSSKTVPIGSVGEMTIPTITTNAPWYSVGSTMTVTWPATAKDTDFYQYWVVIKNITTGTKYYGGATTAAAGDPSKNSVSIKCSDAGMYKIDVYSVPYSDKNARSKVSSKTVPVGIDVSVNETGKLPDTKKTSEIGLDNNNDIKNSPINKVVKIRKVYWKSGVLKVKYAAIKDATEYQLQYSTNKKFKNAKKKSVKKTMYTIKKLKKKKIYYIRVRACKVRGNKKIYGKWSKVKKVKTGK